MAIDYVRQDSSSLMLIRPMTLCCQTYEGHHIACVLSHRTARSVTTKKRLIIHFHERRNHSQRQYNELRVLLDEDNNVLKRQFKIKNPLRSPEKQILKEKTNPTSVRALIDRPRELLDTELNSD